MNISDAHRGTRVCYIPREEYGYISSHSEKYIFVKFEKDLRKRSWHEVTSQACHPNDLMIISEEVPTIYGV